MKSAHIVPWLSIALIAANARAQSVVRSVVGSPIGSGFGRAIERYADLDGDGLPELLVGAPNPSGFGRVSVISSRYIANATGSPVLWSVQGTQLGSTFGASILNLGDVTGDGVADFAVGAPLQPPGSTLPEVDIVSGASHAIVGSATLIALVSHIGTALAPLGDRDSDGIPDFVVGCTGFSTGAFSGSGFLVASTGVILGGSNSWIITSMTSSPIGDLEGTSVSTGDIDGDGQLDIVTGAPGANGGAGEVRIYRAPGYTLWKSFAGTPGERLGTSVDASRDITADGRTDILVGAPNAPAGGFQRGEAIVLSGARMIANTPPFDVLHWTGNTDGEHFGTSVSSTFDLNGDFVADAVVGAPDWSSIFSGGAGRVGFYSGATGASFGSLFGQPGDGLGDAVSDAGAYDGSFHSDVALGGSTSDVGGTNAGVLRVAKLFPTTPSTYCTSKTNSLGCVPSMSYSGSPSATVVGSFLIKANNLLNNKSGLLFYGFQPNATPFQGGTLCVMPPTKRTALQSTHGNPPPDDCSGAMSFDFNLYVQFGFDPTLGVGSQVFAQYWSRDPASPSTTSLTNALRFVINP